jgi:energy-coupling factor transporter ATP-binding protein EcfA2
MNDLEKKATEDSSSARATLSLLALSLKNIGPFDSAEIEFLTEGNAASDVPVTIITGENGSGKSIIIDAIRGMFGDQYAKLERKIWRPSTPFEIRLAISRDGRRHDTSSTEPGVENNFKPTDQELVWLPYGVERNNAPARGWVVDFWRSNLATDSHAIDTLSPQNHRHFLGGSLQGHHQNADATKLLCYFDYLRDSRMPREKRAGDVLFETAREIVQLSLLDGELLDVARSTLTPMVRQGGQTVPLANLSSGNAYMIQRMIGMLGKMYAVNVLREDEPERMCLTPGVLLLDEAENHLHPRWQKRFLGDVLRLFPNLQIIATTHSPFVVGSVPGARVFVCRYDPHTRSATVENVTRDYADLPVDDILISSAFDGVEPFGAEISELMRTRADAIETGDDAARTDAEAKLYDRNPRYFSYLKLDERVRALRAQG